tara:strand:- start:6200 stop:7690 length:1491 start_codon:yes stop_codon:yes gene_type:complete
MPRSLGWKPLVGLFLIVFCAYGYFYQAGGWNQNSRFDLVRANVESGTSRIDPYHRNTGDKACRGPEGRCVKAGPNTHFYCDKAPGASWLAIPSYAVLYWTTGGDSPSADFLAVAAYVASLTSVALPSALAVVALFWLLLLFGIERRTSLGLALGYGLATLAFPYATLFYGHQLAAALLLLGFVALASERKGVRTLSRKGLFAAGAVLGMSVVVEYPSAVPLIAISVYALTFLRPWQRLAWLAAGIAVPGLCCAVYHWMVFGGPATLPYEFSTQPHRSQGFFMGLGIPEPEVLKELLIGHYRGLLYSAPWLAAAVPGAILMFRNSTHRAELYVSIFVVVFVFWLNSSLVDWQGGWAMGPRYLISAIPFLVIMASGLFLPGAIAHSSLRVVVAALVLALGLYSAHMMLMGAAVKPEVPSHIEAPYKDYLRPNFTKGKLSISTQGIDMPNAPRRAAPAAWNLGQKVFGLSGRTSLLPLFVLQLLLLGWLWRKLRAPGPS